MILNIWIYIQRNTNYGQNKKYEIWEVFGGRLWIIIYILPWEIFLSRFGGGEDVIKIIL